MAKTIILGVDPGSRCTGYAVIWVDGSQQGCITCGDIKTPNGEFAERLLVTHDRLSEIIEQYQPNEAAIEQVFVHINPSAALKLGQARGCALTVFAKYGLPIGEYSPKQIKQATVGYGAAAKNQMQHMVQRIFQLTKLPPPDAADALAIAMCHANHRTWRNKTKV